MRDESAAALPIRARCPGREARPARMEIPPRREVLAAACWRRREARRRGLEARCGLTSPEVDHMGLATEARWVINGGVRPPYATPRGHARAPSRRPTAPAWPSPRPPTGRA